jgi:hypothetical protein
MWKKIWKLQVPERVRSFIWLLKHGRLLTNYRKSKMGMGSSFCAFCGDVEETELHVLRDCPRCMNVWLNIIHGNKREVFFNSTLQQWINININGTIEGIEVNKWDSYWASACHSLWYWRNKESHDYNYNRPIDSKQYILKRVKDYIMQSRVASMLQVHHAATRQEIWTPVREVGWVTINTDGARRNNNVCDCGGLIRGNGGAWLGGFAKGLGECRVMVAELWGAFEGLKLAWERGYKKVELQLDAQNVVKVIN